MQTLRSAPPESLLRRMAPSETGFGSWTGSLPARYRNSDMAKDQVSKLGLRFAVTSSCQAAPRERPVYEIVDSVGTLVLRQAFDKPRVRMCMCIDPLVLLSRWSHNLEDRGPRHLHMHISRRCRTVSATKPGSPDADRNCTYLRGASGSEPTSSRRQSPRAPQRDPTLPLGELPESTHVNAVHRERRTQRRRHIADSQRHSPVVRRRPRGGN